ncbi:DUF86 domain-containing protein [Alicyclobacillus dauci]|uniref:DUF86 domain-containing protein n=1 Tax=Alicyclobacillus dauci TaxID=1475485 RepID=A0ABY6YYZ0_9BACL|nr:HepT-like ribonuclease domain-containing protein [Alicyclobacillus dauci]WAH35725.1 DUF86 domain-containing protein [Alicyclobacillus dauci]
MFVTEAQKEQIRAWLKGLDERVSWMLTLAQREDPWELDLTWRLAAERALHTSVEYTTDIGSLIIDALVMRDPGGYADILKVLVEENVLENDWFVSFSEIMPLRARFIRDHANVQPHEVREAVERFGPMFPAFSSAIVQYFHL